MERLAAIVLAAGRSTRMDGFKPLLELDGRSLLEWALHSFVTVGIDDVVIVTGHRGDEVAALACWLASEDCSFSTGGVFDISGGRATY